MSDIFINFGAFIVGVIVSMLSLSKIAEVVFKEFTKQFEKQIDYYKGYTNDVLRAHLKEVDSSQKYTLEIHQNFNIIEQKIHNISSRLHTLNESCKYRAEMENEIIKLKNIIKRQNKTKEK